MSAQQRGGGMPMGRVVSWLVGSVLVGWLIAYNIMRLAGQTPSGAAWTSLAIGGAAGLGAFALLMVAARRLAAAGRVVHRGVLEVPSPAELDPAQRYAMRLAWPAMGALAALALLVGVYLGADWLGTDPGQRATTTIILAAWDVLAGLWLGDEALRLRRGEGDGVESAPLGCALTAVLAGVGISRDLVVGANAALIVLAGAAGLLAGVVAWRLAGARGIPAGGIVVAAVAVLSLVLPLAL